MKNFFKVVFSRAVFTGAFIALQFAAVYLAITRFNEHFAIFYGVCLVLSAVVVVYLVSRDGNPAYKIAWIIPILRCRCSACCSISYSEKTSSR